MVVDGSAILTSWNSNRRLLGTGLNIGGNPNAEYVNQGSITGLGGNGDGLGRHIGGGIGGYNALFFDGHVKALSVSQDIYDKAKSVSGYYECRSNQLAQCNRLANDARMWAVWVKP
jgi:prepilin-type processing-associated H-X9-DG protein